MASIWTIESGEYSDYHIVGIFSTRENAQLVCDKLNNEYDTFAPTERPLDPAVYELNNGFNLYRVLMLRDGSVEKLSQEETSEYAVAGSKFLWRRSKARAFQLKNMKDALNMTVWATDEQHAIKIVNEYRAQLIAKGEWDE